MTDREVFKENLNNLMRISKVKQIDIAKYAEVSYQTVSAWVCGRVYPRAESMEKLCKFFVFWNFEKVMVFLWCWTPFYGILRH